MLRFIRCLPFAARSHADLTHLSNISTYSLPLSHPRLPIHDATPKEPITLAPPSTTTLLPVM
jgi:hypothetical protein